MEHLVPDHESLPEIPNKNIIGVSKYEDSSLEKVEYEQLDVKPTTLVPLDCLSTVSMPKNWSQVERLKQQRLLLHQQLFAKKSNVKNDIKQSETVDGNFERQNNSFDIKADDDELQAEQKQRSSDFNFLYSTKQVSDDETDTCSSDDEIPRLHIAECYTSIERDDVHSRIPQRTVSSDNLPKYDGIVQNEKTHFKEQDFCKVFVKTENSCEESDENCSQKSLNSSDLCDLTASKINEALHSAIASLTGSNKDDKNRIRQVLVGLKMKAEEKESDNLGYRISKALATAARPSNSASDVDHISDESSRLVENKSDPNLTLAKNNADTSVLNPTKYVGFPVDVNNVSGEFDYKNIAWQKYLAENRLKEQETNEVGMNGKENSQRIQESDRMVEKSVIQNTSSIESAKKEKRELEQKKELCQLKHQLYQKRIQAEGPRSHDLKERILLAKQKMIEAKEKMLEAEMKLNRHKLKMVEKGIPIRMFPYLPYHFIQDSFNEDTTDSDDEICRTGITNSPLVKDFPVSMTEPQMPVDQNELKTQREMSETNTECNNSEIESVPDNQKISMTAISKNGTVRKSSTENEPKQKLVKSSISSENLDSKEEVVSLQDKSGKQGKEIANINVNSKGKKINKKRKVTKTRGRKKSEERRTPVRKVSPVQTKTSSVLKGKTSSSPNTSSTTKVVVANKLFPTSVVEARSADNDVIRCSPHHKESSQGQPAEKVLIPQNYIQQSTANNLHPVIPGGGQEPSARHAQPNHADKFLLPSGFVKDDTTNKIFHTYHFNGHTFAMIDNKLYQVHLRNSDGKIKTVIGAVIPTVAAAVSVNTRPKMVNAVVSRHLSLASVATATCSAPSVLRFTPAITTVVTSAKLPTNPISYRFPVNMIQSAARTSQPLNLLIITTTSSSAATQSTQVIRKPLMNVSIGNNYVKAQLQKTVCQSASITNPVLAHNPGMGGDILQLQVTSPHTAVNQSVNPVNVSMDVANKRLLTPVTVTKSVISQPANQKIIYVSPPKCKLSSQLARTQVSPVAKSLLTNRTYITMDSSPVEITNECRMSTNVATQRLEYCGSVVVNSTAISQGTSKNQIAKDSTSGSAQSFTSDKHETNTDSALKDIGSNVVKTLEKNLNSHTVTYSNSDLTLKQTSTEIELEKTKENCKRIFHNGQARHHCSKDSLPKTSPAKICSSMDSFLYTAKRKRKGTPFKILGQSSTSSLEQQMEVSRNTTEDTCKNNPADQKDISAEDREINRNSAIQSDKISDPVPFLDFPARIVPSGRSGSCGKSMEIVASPKHRIKNGHNSDTSLDEEKMAKMISFANMLEEEVNYKEAVNEELERKRIFKKRRTDSRTSEESKVIVAEIDTAKAIRKSPATDENAKTLEGDKRTEIAIPLCKEQEKKIIREPVLTLVKYGETETLQQPAVNVNEDSTHSRDRERNMFDEFEQLVSKQNSETESCNESNESYDSSDLENYDKFVFSQTHTSTLKKPKSQFIESYYTSQCMEEMRRRNIEPKQYYPIAGSYITSKSSAKITELGTVETKAPTKTARQQNSSETTEIKQDTSTENLKRSKVNVEPCSNQDIGQDTSQKVGQKPLVSVGGRQVKKFIKTKFIILKGDICDRWFEIKRKTGFGEMSDPKFIHYLLRLEEERQTKMKQIQEDQAKRENREGDLTENMAATAEDVVQENADFGSVVDINNNNNNANNSMKERESYSDQNDMEDMIVNVTDTPESSPRLSDLCISDIECQICPATDGINESGSLSDTSTSASEEKVRDKRGHVSHDNIVVATELTSSRDTTKASEKAPSRKHSRKRRAAKNEDSDIPASKKHFAILSDATQRQMRWAVSLFREWLKEKGEEDIQFEYRDSAWLDDKLAKFYADALSHEGTPYSTFILQTFRRSLSLYLSSDSNNKNVHISIAQDPEYGRSNSVLSSLMFTETRRNTSNVQERDVNPITEVDMEKIYKSRTLSDDDPTHLLWKVWFDITYYLCRGRLPRNFWRSLTKRSLVLESDVNGVFFMFADYVYLPPDEEPGKMYATPEDPEKCPVKSLSLYLSKLCANCEALFQCSKTSWNRQESWYWPVPMSREKLDKIILQISAHAKLSKVYDVSSVLLTAKRRNTSKIM